VPQMIPGIDFNEILTAFVDAFDSDDLEEMVRFRLDLKLRTIVAPGPDRRRIFKLLEWAEQRGLMVELIRAAYLERPNNPQIREIYQKFGLAVAVAVQHAGGGVPNAPTFATAPALEAVVKPRLKMVDLGIWGEKLAKVEGQVCRIDFDGNPNGSGFLVGPDLVLTNYHVLAFRNGSRSRNFLMEAHVRNWIERCSCTRHCRPHHPPDPPKKAYVRRNEFVEGSDAPLKSREEVSARETAQ